MEDWARDRLEDVRVWWLMRPGEQKQAIILGALYVFSALLSLATAKAEARMKR